MKNLTQVIKKFIDDYKLNFEVRNLIEFIVIRNQSISISIKLENQDTMEVHGKLFDIANPDFPYNMLMHILDLIINNNNDRIIKMLAAAKKIDKFVKNCNYNADKVSEAILYNYYDGKDLSDIQVSYKHQYDLLINAAINIGDTTYKIKHEIIRNLNFKVDKYLKELGITDENS